MSSRVVYSENHSPMIWTFVLVLAVASAGYFWSRKNQVSESKISPVSLHSKLAEAERLNKNFSGSVIAQSVPVPVAKNPSLFQKALNFIRSPQLKSEDSVAPSSAIPVEAGPVPGTAEAEEIAIEDPIPVYSGINIPIPESQTKEESESKKDSTESGTVFGRFMATFTPNQNPTKTAPNVTPRETSPSTEQQPLISDDLAASILAAPNFSVLFSQTATQADVQTCVLSGNSMSSANCGASFSEPSFDPSRFGIDLVLQPSANLTAQSQSGPAKIKFMAQLNLQNLISNAQEQLQFSIEPENVSISESTAGGATLRTIQFSQSSVQTARGPLQNVLVKLVVDVTNNAWTLTSGSELRFGRSQFDSTSAALLSGPGSLNQMGNSGFTFLRVQQFDYSSALGQIP